MTPQYTRGKALLLCKKEVPEHQIIFPTARFFCYDNRIICSKNHSVKLVGVWKEGDVVIGEGDRSVIKKWNYKEDAKNWCN